MATSTVDMVIIGSGTSIAIALAGHEKGLKSLSVEEMVYVGGFTISILFMPA